MSLQALYSIIGVLCVVAEIVLLVILVVRRQYKAFPVFTFYIAYNLLSDFLIGAAVSAYSMRIARPLQFASLPLQYLLELGVLIEIAWNVLRPVHSALPRYATRVLKASVAMITLHVWSSRGIPPIRRSSGPAIPKD